MQNSKGSVITVVLAAIILVALLAFGMTAGASASEIVIGDVDGNGRVDSGDAVYLLYNTLFGDGEYPVNQDCDFNSDGVADQADAIYLMYHTLYGAEKYPLPGESGSGNASSGSSSPGNTSSGNSSSDKDQGFDPWVPIG